MDYPQPSPKGAKPMGAVHRLNGSGHLLELLEI
jgi:hypothetical protein